MLSIQATFAAPIITMAKNRPASIDRNKVEQDHDVNLKAELEIEFLHQKVVPMREQEIGRLAELIEKQAKANRKDVR
ncbi:MAG TPA: DUF1003 domain-containing protein [Dongiaceae bacterium]